ncbi:MAG: protein-disulfide reductase DsbD family protein, partial [Planctomycetota bacterium]
DHRLAFEVRYTGCGPDVCQFLRQSPSAVLSVLPAQQAAGPSALPEAGGEQPAAAAEPPPAAAPPEPGGEAIPLSAAPPQEGPFAGRGPVVAVLLSFLAGLGLTFTPCVYPLIPVTVSLVGATAGGSRLDGLVRSLVYVFGISVTYSLVGVVAAATGGMFGAWLQHPAVYVALAVLFVLLAGAMFDLYSIELASQRTQRLQAGLRGRAGMAGIWVVGVLSGAAATACIAPVIIGVLSYVAQRGSMLLGFLMFFAMAWGMGVPLIAAGTFSGVARSLPRSGEWMVAVKRIFGLALLAVAVYFVGKSRLLPAEWFRMLVGAFLVGAGAFAGAFDVLSPRAGAWPRLRKAAGALLIVAALMVLFGPYLRGATTVPAPEADSVRWLQSEPEALARARAEGKPVLLDFWADWCAPCKRMFQVTFRDPRVVAESRRFVCARIDVSRPDAPAVQALLEEYGVRGVPATVLIGPAGRRRSHSGYLDPDDVLRFMRSLP